jgi:hypothetical protein
VRKKLIMIMMMVAAIPPFGGFVDRLSAARLEGEQNEEATRQIHKHRKKK